MMNVQLPAMRFQTHTFEGLEMARLRDALLISREEIVEGWLYGAIPPTPPIA